MQHGYMLSQGEDLERSVASTSEEESASGQERKGEFEHELYVVA